MPVEEARPGDDSLLGRVVAGKFGLRRLIGAGASGSVFQADQIALGRTVAVKILRPDLARDARFVRRFHDEALASSRLNHPNVVSVIDYGQTEDGLLYLVMEYLRGPTLTQVLRAGSLSTARIADIVSQILAGLEEAHDSGVIHADLKSDNVVVDHRRNDWDLVKVVDFGIARLVETPFGGDGETICGTPEYMAPEVISGGEPTYASDLYAVGVVVYEMLTGVTPFAGGPTMEVLRRHLGDEPLRPSQRRPGALIERALEDIALIALAKDPSRRFASAAEFRTALLRAQRSSVDPMLAERVVCHACSVASPVSFKFCPECGHPRDQAGHTVDVPMEIVDGLLSADELSGLSLRDSDQASTEDLPAGAASLAWDAGERAIRQHAGLVPLPLYGRGEDLHNLIDFLTGRSADRALHLAGPVGVGRSRLLREAFSVLTGRLDGLLIAGADPSGFARTYLPIRTALTGLLGLRSGDDLIERLDAVGLNPRDAPGLLELLGREGSLWQLEPAVRRREMAASLLRAFQVIGERRRTVMVFDDFDRFDRPSQDMVRRLVEATQGGDTLRVVVVSSRELEAPWVQPIARLELGPLPDAAVVDLASFLAASGNPSLPGEAELRSQCGGSPSHIHQLVRYAIEGGVASAAPSSLADLVAARIDLLPQAARVVCQAAAVLGGASDLAVIREMLGEHAEDGEVLEAMSILEARGLLVRDSHGAVRFDEQVVRDVAYASTPADVRRALHREASQVLASSADPTVLGHHHLAAGELEPAATLLTRAGDDAVHDLDDLAARRLYTDSLSAARQLMLQDSDPAARSRFGGISVKLADALIGATELGLARGVLEEARYLCADAPGMLALLGGAIAHLHAAEPDDARATAALRDAIRHAIIRGQRELLCELYLDLATQCVRAGAVEQAIGELAEGIDVVTMGEGSAGPDGPAPLWRLCFRRAQLLAAQGDSRGAVQCAEDAIRHGERVAARAGVARIQTMLAGLYDKLGRVDRANYNRGLAVQAMRALGDRRGIAELLLASARPTETLRRITGASLREAEALATEIGWSEGVSRARRASDPPNDHS